MTAAIQRAYVWPTHYLTKFPAEGGAIVPSFKLENDGNAEAGDVAFSASLNVMSPSEAKAVSYEDAPETSVGTIKQGAVSKLPAEPIGQITASDAIAIMSGAKWLVLNGAVAWTDQFDRRVSYRWISYTTITGGQWASDIIRDETLVEADTVPVEAAPVAVPLPAMDEKLADWGDVEEDTELTTDDLLSIHSDDAEKRVRKLTRAKRRKFTELLNVELSELQQERGGPGEDLKREGEIEALLGLFARVGEM